MIKVFKYFRRSEWLMLAAIFILLIFQSYLELEIPGYIGKVIDIVQSGKATTSDVWRQGGKMIAYSAGSILLLIVIGLISARMGAGIGMTLRKKLFHKIESFSLQELGGFSTSSLITRTTNDVHQVIMAVTMGLRFMIKSPVIAVIAIIKSQSLSAELTGVIAIAVGLLVAFILCMLIFVLPQFKKIQKVIDKVNGVTRENLTGLRVVRAYNAEGYQEKKFEEANIALTKTNKFVNRIMSLMEPYVTLIMNGLSVTALWLGSYLLFKDNLSGMGDIQAFTMYATYIIMSFIFLTMVFILFPRASVSAKRINEVLEKPLVIVDGEGAEPVEKGTVEFKNVSFKYPDAEECVLRDISFKADNGQVVAFIGSTGSGKSTLIKLIPRFFDVTDGSVLVDGVDVRRYTQKQLRSRIGYVPQKGVLFSGNIKENIVYGDTVATDEEMEKAARIAKADSFINEKPERYDSAISRGGTNVSGGQKQRLSIARALVKNPEIFVFDDSFSALDYKTDKELRAGLKANTSATCLIVAQRIGTILHADKIIVLNEGRIAGEGTHSELLKNCKVYQEIAYSQLSKEELEQ